MLLLRSFSLCLCSSSSKAKVSRRLIVCASEFSCDSRNTENDLSELRIQHTYEVKTRSASFRTATVGIAHRRSCFSGDRRGAEGKRNDVGNAAIAIAARAPTTSSLLFCYKEARAAYVCVVLPPSGLPS